jgi:hypothetical protein
MLLSAGPGGEGEEHPPVGLVTKQRGCLGSPCTNHAVTIVVAAIFGRSSDLISTSTAEACGTVARARPAQEIKWFVPDVLGVAGGGFQALEKSSRAGCSLISTAKPRGRRRSGCGEAHVLDCFSQSFYKGFSKKRRHYLQIIGSLEQVL